MENKKVGYSAIIRNKTKQQLSLADLANLGPLQSLTNAKKPGAISKAKISIPPQAYNNPD